MTLPRYAAIVVLLATFGLAGTASSGSTPPGQSPPTSTAAPTIGGTPQVALQLSGVSGSFSGPTSGTVSQWLRCDSNGANCGPIAGATASTLTLVAADYGTRIRFSSTAWNRRGSTTSTSAPTMTVQPPPPTIPPVPPTPPPVVGPTALSAPTIAGTTVSGQTLVATNGGWSGTTPMSFVATWQRCDASGNACAAVAGASSTSYLLSSADVAHAFRVSFTASNSAGSKTSTSSPTAAVTAPTVAPVSTTVSPTSLAGGIVGTTYSQTVTATGGYAPYHFIVSAGSLPTGTTLASSGAFTGMPTAAGTFSFSVSALDGANVNRASRAYTVAIAAAPVPPPSSGGQKLAWAPPALSSPVTLAVPSVAPVSLTLDSTKDYILKLGHISGPGGLTVRGGRNVVIVGGQVTAVTNTTERDGYAMRFYDQTGIVHIEGVLIDNSGDGITVQAPQATFQIQNVRIANNHAFQDNFSYAHPDLIQTWSGPSKMRIDRFTGYSDYQGFTWLNAGSSYVYPGSVTATNVNIAPLAPQPNTVLKYKDGTTRDKPSLSAGVWHVSPSTVFSCNTCFMKTGWYDTGYLKKLDDSIGGYMNADGSYADPYYEFRGTDGATYISPLSPTGGIGNKTNPIDLGRRQGDVMTSPKTPNLANERWTWGAPSGGDYVPASVPGTAYVSPGYN